MNTSELQRTLAKAIGINVSDDNFYIAAARLAEVIWPALVVHNKSDHPASEKQLAFAREIDFDVEGDDRSTASRRIAARLELLDEIALRKLNLKPGDKVVLKKKPKEICVVSCVGKNRRIYFKGWGGESVAAMQILKKK